MVDGTRSTEGEPPQFDRAVVDGTTPTAASRPGVVCAACRASIETEYFHVNGHVVCDRCRATVQSAVDARHGAGPLVMAGLFGLGGGMAGAAIYYAVMAI